MSQLVHFAPVLNDKFTKCNPHVPILEFQDPQEHLLDLMLALFEELQIHKITKNNED